MKICIDTSTLINLCKNKDDFIDKFVDIIERLKISLFIPPTVQEEFKSRTKNEQDNFERLEKYVIYDNQRYFTLDKSTLDGPDILPGSAYEAFNHPIDSIRAYKESGSLKSPEGWIQKKQSDPNIYSRAVDLDCDYFITENLNDFKNKDEKFKTKIFNLKEFINLLG